MTVINGNYYGQIISNRDWRLSNEIPGVQTELVLTVEIFNSFLTIAHHPPLKVRTHIVLKLVSKCDKLS